MPTNPTITGGRTWVDGETVTPARMNASANDAQIHVSSTDVLIGRSTAGPGLAEEIPCTAAGRALLDDTDAAAQRATLGVADYLQLNNDVLTYGASVALDFSTAAKTAQTITLTGNVTLTTSGLASSRTKLIRLVGDGSSRTLTFPAGWKFLGSAAPASLAASKTALLALIAFGSTNADVVATYAVEA